MNSRDVNTLQENLKQLDNSVEVKSIYLKDFVRENQFTDAVRYNIN